MEKSVGQPNEHMRKNLADFSELTEDIKKDFCEMIDDMVLSCDDDPELVTAFKFLNDESFKRRITLYEMCFLIWEDCEINEHVQDWRREKGF